MRTWVHTAGFVPARTARVPRVPTPGRTASAKASASPPELQRKRKTRPASTFFIVLVLVALAACDREPRPYAEQIADHRARVDQFMRESSESPIPVEKRPTFPPLSYFAVDPAYRVPAQLQPAEGGASLEMPTSTGQKRQMRRVGKLAFTLKGQPMTLGAFVEAGQEDMRRLFVPFGDLTNGTETYPGGRYLDLDRTATGIYDLDFNRAYHPYCVFNSSYDCPYPPAENRLKVPIRAGERLPK